MTIQLNTDAYMFGFKSRPLSINSGNVRVFR